MSPLVHATGHIAAGYASLTRTTGRVPHPRSRPDADPEDMDLLSLVRQRLVVPRLQATDKFEAIEELIDFLVAENEIPDEARSTVLEAVLRREEERPTGIGQGISMPHALVDLLDREVAALGLSPCGVPFGAFDGKAAQIVILLVTPRSLAFRHSDNVRKIVCEMCQTDFRPLLENSLSSGEIVDYLLAARP